MAYLSGERQQLQLLPPSIEEYISADDPVRVYDAFVSQLDLGELGIEWDSGQVGPPEYEPRAMLKLLVYGYSYGLRSSRKLERATHHNLSFIWLLGGLKPDHKTIARFRCDHREALKKVLRQTVRLCLKLGLIEGNTLFVDGTKVRANAAVGRSWTKVRWKGYLRQVDERIEKLFAECEAVDGEEEGSGSLVRVERKLRNAERVREQIAEVLQEFSGEESKKINATDGECCLVKSGGAVKAGYNLQTVVDDRHGLIVQTDVVAESNDQGQFGLQVEQANESLGQPCEVACADAGYADTGELKLVAKRGIAVIVPSQDQARRKPSGPFSKDKFIYDQQRDCYLCPAGQTLGYRKTDLRAGVKAYQIKPASLCRRCRFWGECTRSPAGRTIVRLLDEEWKQRLEAEYARPESQVIYRRRKEKVEIPFGHFKRNLGIQAFLLRGLAGVKAEAGLFATAFNLTRAITLWGVPRLLQQWATA